MEDGEKPKRERWRKPRSRVGPNRERPYRALGQYFAQLRVSQGLSQEELAFRSALTKHRFDRTYIARIENGEAADSAAKFLVYAAMLHANPETVLEIINATEKWVEFIEDLPIEEYLPRIKSESNQGNYNIAGMYALAGLTKANLQNDATWRVKYQLSAAIVFNNRGQHSVAKSLAEEVLNAEAASPPMQVRASVILATSSIYLDKLLTARGALRSIEIDHPSIEPELTAHLLYTKGFVELVLQRAEAAEPLLRGALELFWKQNNFAEIARSSAKLAELCAQTGRSSEAWTLAKQCLAFAKKAEHVALVGWGHLALGRLHIASRDRGESKEHLLTAEQNGKWRGDEELLFLARVSLMEWSHVFDDKVLIRFMREHVRTGLKKLRLARHYRALASAALNATHQEGP
jgi:transcriptional regulator with XRE-family HTH domain